MVWNAVNTLVRNPDHGVRIPSLQAAGLLSDGNALVAEYDGAQTRPHVYVHGVGEDVPLMWYDNGGGGRRIYADHQGSIVAIAHPTNAYLAVNGYDAWGIPNANNKGRFQYTGQVWLPELGMYHYKARIYSPTLGRFMDALGRMALVHDHAGKSGTVTPFAAGWGYPLSPSSRLIRPRSSTSLASDA